MKEYFKCLFAFVLIYFINILRYIPPVSKHYFPSSALSLPLQLSYLKDQDYKFQILIL